MAAPLTPVAPATPSNTVPPATLLTMVPPDSAAGFLAAAGWGDAAVVPLAGDASFRRYFRVVEAGRTAVLMDAPPDKEDSRPFLAIAEHLCGLGFDAPRALAIDLDAGLILLDDFGDDRVAPRLAADPTPERAIYETAIDILASLHAHAPPPHVAPYARAELLREVNIFTEWYLPAVGSAPAPGYDEAWDAVWADVIAETEASPVLTLRDFHADNLMLLGSPERLGLLDFQDALAGHPAYDLVSLLQDARRDVSPALEAAMIDRYVAARGLPDRQAFRAAYEVLGAQRNVKILGVFSRLWKRDGKPGYRAFQPRVWGLVERNLKHPALAPVAAWFDANVPADRRAAAWRA